jgi:peptidoglycan/xylan/chitin deacetylase (PgdA/CDA1 family)
LSAELRTFAAGGIEMKKILLLSALLTLDACGSGKFDSQDVPGADRSQVVTDPGRLEDDPFVPGNGTVLAGNPNLKPVVLKIFSLASSNAASGTAAVNVTDGSLATRWSGIDMGSWIKFDLGTRKPVSAIKIAWHRGDLRKATYDLDFSDDGLTWKNVRRRAASSGLTNRFERLDLSGQQARFVRLTGFGNTENSFNSVLEFAVESFDASIDPNPGPTPTPTPPITGSNCGKPQVTLTGGPYISFIADDSPASDYLNLLPIFLKENLKFASAVVSGRIQAKQTWQMSADQLRALEAGGMEIMSHTSSHGYLTGLGQDSMLRETGGSLTELKALGVHPSSHIAYPMGATNTNVIAEVCKHFSFAYVTGGGINQTSFAPYAIRRQGIYNTDADNASYRFIDEVIARKGWLVLMIHAGMRPPFRGGPIEEAIRYAKERGVPILTPAQVAMHIQ